MCDLITLHFNFLYSVLNSSPTEFKRRIADATTDELRSVLVCISLSKKTKYVQKCKTLAKLSSKSGLSSDIRPLLLKCEATVRLVLSMVLSKLVNEACENVLFGCEK